MSKADHTIDCPSRQNNKCTCYLGYQRWVINNGKAVLKRKRKKIAKKLDIPYEDTLVLLTPGKGIENIDMKTKDSNIQPHNTGPKLMVEDQHPIISITWGPTTWAVGDLMYRYPADKRLITKIVAYQEVGHPWVAFYAKNEIIARADCTGSLVCYY